LHLAKRQSWGVQTAPTQPLTIKYTEATHQALPLVAQRLLFQAEYKHHGKLASRVVPPTHQHAVLLRVIVLFSRLTLPLAVMPMPILATSTLYSAIGNPKYAQKNNH
jgi:hypothetical protein